METTTNRKDPISWKYNCSSCDCEFESYYWGYDDSPVEFCCSPECYEEYYSIENKRNRRIKLILNDNT